MLMVTITTIGTSGDELKHNRRRSFGKAGSGETGREGDLVQQQGRDAIGRSGSIPNCEGEAQDGLFRTELDSMASAWGEEPGQSGFLHVASRSRGKSWHVQLTLPAGSGTESDMAFIPRSPHPQGSLFPASRTIS
ncbi:uncharacterized protein [Physcomitrium patens]|uniref:uncharacterized protein isoform X3 n=1 Tax=Physcomitrium patens TaxID=3218 RepID=UPI003CCCDD00